MDAALNLAARAQKSRAIYEYTLPPELAGQDDFIKTSIGLQKLEMDEEVQATERAKCNAARLAYGMARAALVEVDGRRVNKAEAEDEKILQHCDPAIRELILV